MTQSGVKLRNLPIIVEKGDKSDLEAVDLIPFCVFLSSVVFSIKFKLKHLLQEQDALMIGNKDASMRTIPTFFF